MTMGLLSTKKYNKYLLSIRFILAAGDSGPSSRDNTEWDNTFSGIFAPCSFPSLRSSALEECSTLRKLAFRIARILHFDGNNTAERDI